MDSTSLQAGYAEAVSKRLSLLHQAIEGAAKSTNRTGSDIQLVGVSKTVDLPQVVCVYQAGCRIFGENRPQELARKYDALKDELPDAQFHMIGNLQTNKINQVLERATLIHSISSEKLATNVSSRAARKNLTQPVLLEVNVSGEDSKSGFTPEELKASFDSILELPNLIVKGLMTMAPQGDKVAAQKTFEGLRLLRDELQTRCPENVHLSELSMGMSEDFIEAIKEGATIIRLGRILFDPSFPFELPVQ